MHQFILVLSILFLVGIAVTALVLFLLDREIELAIDDDDRWFWDEVS